MQKTIIYRDGARVKKVKATEPSQQVLGAYLATGSGHPAKDQ